MAVSDKLPIFALDINHISHGIAKECSDGKVHVYWRIKEMKKVKVKYLVALSVTVLVLFLLLLNDYMSYSMRIGNTPCYLVETMAISKDGRPLLGLYCKTKHGGYKGVEMRGFPKNVLWNDKYLISKNYNGNDMDIISYVIINQDSVNISDGDIADLHIFEAEADYYNYLRQIELSESEMEQIDYRITWWKLLFK